MLGEITVPTLVIRGSGSDMFAAETLDKVRSHQSARRQVELAGSHDLAGDNPDGLAKAVGGFLANTGI